MNSPFPERGEFVPVQRPGPQDVPPGHPYDAAPGSWPAQQPWHGPMYAPMPQLDVGPTPLPRAVRASGWLWLAASLLYVAGWVVAAFVDVPFVAADMASDPEFDSPEDARPVAITMFVVGVMGATVAAILYSVFGFLLWRRQNWARVLLAVLGGIMLLVLPADVMVGAIWRSGIAADEGNVWSGFAVVAGLAAAQFGLTVAAMVTMFTSSSNRFFSGGRRG